MRVGCRNCGPPVASPDAATLEGGTTTQVQTRTQIVERERVPSWVWIVVALLILSILNNRR